MWKLYCIDNVRVLSLIRNYKGEKSPVEEKVIAFKCGSLKLYQDVFYKSCQYSFVPILVSPQETIEIGGLSEIHRYCTSLELKLGRISRLRLIEIYNQINLPDYRIEAKQLKLREQSQKKYGDI